MKPWLPILLSANAGYVDTAGFLALQGLFTAHVTGNFVTLGAALAFGTSGVIAKLIALPVFCAVVAVVRLSGYVLNSRGSAHLNVLLGTKLILLITGAALAVRLGPFTNGDEWPAMLTGMVLVSAMAVQNATQRLHLGSVPPTTIMTGNTTQVMIDLIDLIRGAGDDAVRFRFVSICANIGAFAIGCGAAALLYVVAHMWCFAVPPLVAALIILLRPRYGAQKSG
ncbi:MAG: YoaK family protein [Rhodomicrobium sp.]